MNIKIRLAEERDVPAMLISDVRMPGLSGLDLLPLVRQRMEAVYALRVPLVVDVGSGQSWREAH